MPLFERPAGRILVATSLALAAACAHAAAIDVPPGHGHATSLDARGVQIYECQAADGALGWAFKAPEATLFDRDGKAVGSHYAGPTWESTLDGSKITGTRVASEPSASAGAIPQLLLSAKVAAPGATFGKVAFVQRLQTVGGAAPAGGCDASAKGTLVRVPYTATYRFFEPE